MHSVLAARSEFSLGESIHSISDLISDAVNAGAKVVGLTDTMSVTAMIDFSRKAKEAGIKPLIGCRLRFVDDVAWRKVKGVRGQPPQYFLTYYALSEKGVQALFRLLTLANSSARYYMVPKLGFDDLYRELDALTADDVAIATSDALSVVHHEDAVSILSQIIARVSASSVFATLVPANTPYWDTINDRALALAAKLQIEPLVTRPTLYGPEKADYQEVMNAVYNNNALSSLWHNSNFVRDFAPLTQRQLLDEVKAAVTRLSARGIAKAGSFFKAGLLNTDKLASRSSYQWERQPVSLPQMAPDEYAALVDQCKKGWQSRFSRKVFDHVPTAIELRDQYKPRLVYELSVIKQLGFSGYFLLVQDLVQYAKNEGILVGPGRGSVGGSLIAYLLGITECDPIRFNLLFERFINPDRIDLPDADLDFMSERRHEVIEYLVAKYGSERVAGISNYSTLAPSSTIRSVGKAFGLPERDYNCSKLVPKEHGQPLELSKAATAVGEIASFRDNNPEIWDVCLTLEGSMRSMATHAAGVVVAGCNLTQRAVIERRKEESVVCWDKQVVEDMGLVKMDILGLATLDQIDLAQKYIRSRHSKKIDLSNIPLDDPKVLENFAKGLTTGIFQFESAGMKKLLRDLGHGGPLSFEDIAAATALYRPGPMDSGMLESYVRRKQGQESVEYDHEAMEPALSTTFGVMAYQEQVMQVARDVAGYSMAEADKLRKIMGKKLPAEMAKQRDKFVDGCVETVGMSEYDAGEIFDKIAKFAGYGFNRSHSIEYSLISYQAMYLKTYYTVEFMAAALSLMKEDKLPALLRDCERLGIEVMMPDINQSTGHFEILTDTKLMIPFVRIKMISEKACSAILEARKAGPFSSRADLEKRVDRRKCNIRHIKNLDAVGAFARIEPSQLPAKHPDRIKDQRELIPGLVNQIVPIGRSMTADKFAKAKIAKVVSDYVQAHGPGDDADGMPVRPVVGRSAKFMVVFDAPSRSEEQSGQMSYGDSFQAVAVALSEAGLSRSDGYWTALIKRPKEGKQVSQEEIKAYAPYLEREIEALKPPVIVLLGSQAVRHFMPDFRGKASDAAGQIVYNKDLDANIVLGFSPGEIWFDESKQTLLNEVFEKVAEIID